MQLWIFTQHCQSRNLLLSEKLLNTQRRVGVTAHTAVAYMPSVYEVNVVTRNPRRAAFFYQLCPRFLRSFRQERSACVSSWWTRTWLGTQSSVLCNRWPTNTHSRTTRGECVCERGKLEQSLRHNTRTKREGRDRRRIAAHSGSHINRHKAGEWITTHTGPFQHRLKL